MLITTLDTIVKFRTVSDNQLEINRALDWVAKQAKDLGLYIYEIKSDHVRSLIIKTRKGKTSKLMLTGHIDVVPASHDLFKVTQVNQKIYGRGVFDMKYAIAAYLHFLNKNKEILPQLDLSVVITSDEEVGGENGTQKVLQRGFTSKICFLPDGGSNWNLVKSSKGVLHIKITSNGKTGHGSRPWEGENAIDKLIKYINSISKNFHNSIIDNEKNMTINVGVISGGEAINKIPNYAEALVDIRYAHNNSPMNILKFMSEAAPRGINIQTILQGDSYSADIKSKELRILRMCAKKHGVVLGFETTYGSSDARYFSKYKIPTIVFRPPGGGHHTEKEWISKKGFEIFYKITEDFILYCA